MAGPSTASRELAATQQFTSINRPNSNIAYRPNTQPIRQQTLPTIGPPYRSPTQQQFDGYPLTQIDNTQLDFIPATQYDASQVL